MAIDDRAAGQNATMGACRAVHPVAGSPDEEFAALAAAGEDVR